MGETHEIPELQEPTESLEDIRPAPVPEPPIDRIGTLLPGDPLTRRPGRFQRFDLIAGTVTVSALLWSAEQITGKLLIMFNGAVRRRDEKHPNEVFQRKTWVNDIRSDILFLSDPTLRSDNTVSIGWGQGQPGGYAVPALAQTAFSVAESLNVPSGDRIYFGSSAGGFQALQVGARDIDARVLVNNAQIDWTLYEPQNVRTICQNSYHGKAPSAVAQDHPDRTSVVRAFTEFENIPRTRYLVNAASENDAKHQLPALVDGLRTAPATASPRVDVSFYIDPNGGHAPLPRQATTSEINQMLDERV